jgi:lambda repressor-like predicted transcriptional regulator
METLLRRKETIYSLRPGTSATVNMDALDISYHLRRLGKSQAQIARELNVTQSVVGNVINNRITAHEVATYIARLLDRKVEDLWPGRYTYKPRGPSANRRRPHLASIDTEDKAMD